MFFYFFDKYAPVAYSSVVTKTPKAVIKAMGFDKWVVETGAYKNLIAALPFIKSGTSNDEAADHLFRTPYLEADGLNKKEINKDHANIFIDVLTGHNKNRLRLNYLIDDYPTAGIYITDISVLGESIEEIISVYERCIKNDKFICVIDNSKPDKVSEFSLARINGEPYPKEKQEEIVNNIATMGNNNPLHDLRGTTKLSLTKEFWIAYFLFEVTMEIPEEFAYIIAGMSKNSFIRKCADIEDNYDQLYIRLGTDFYTYHELLEKSFAQKKLDETNFYDIPKRYGALPKSESMTFAELREFFTPIDNSDIPLAEKQKQLDDYCINNGFKRMLYLNYRRYCAKMDNPSKKTFGKYYNYNQNIIDAFNMAVESTKQSCERLQVPYDPKYDREMLLKIYSFEI